jgi:hypothetical protein
MPDFMKLIRRAKSVITGRKNLEHLFVFKKYPVFIGCTDEPRKKDLLSDMSFSICRDSGVIQLDKLVPLDILYSRYHSEAIGGLWHEHHRKFVDFLSGLLVPRNILEIGGSNCVMAEQYLKKHRKTKWIIVEPNPAGAKNPRIKIIPEIFDNAFKTDEKIDAVVHSHVLEHMYDPDWFMKKINSLIGIGGLHVFSVPNLYRYLVNGYSNCMNFEHTIFLTDHFIDYLLAKNGFKVIRKKYFHEHSIFYAAKKVGKNSDAMLESRYREYKRLFMKYVNDNKKTVADINRKIHAAKGNVYLFGAHVFSQMLLNLGLNRKRIRCILDNSKIKEDKRLYGTDLSVKSPSLIASEKAPVVILRAGAYQQEIKNQLRKLNKSTVFIE